MPSDCLFCKIAAGDIPANVRYLLIPRKHIATTLDLQAEDNLLVGHVFQVAAKIATDLGFAEEGFRIVNNCNEAGGQTVWHLHFHLLGQRQLTWPPG